MITFAADRPATAAEAPTTSVHPRTGRVPVLDVALGGGLSVVGVLAVSGDDRFGPAALGMVLLGLPLLLRTRAPTAGLLALGLSTWVNALLFGDEVRCGELVLGLTLLAFASARHTVRRLSAVPVVLTAVVLLGEVDSDPIARGGGLPMFLALGAGALALGFLTRRRDEVLGELRSQEQRLRGAREATLRAAAEAERLRVGAGLSAVLAPKVLGIEAAARTGLADTPSAAASLRQIEDTARSAIVEVRSALLAIRSDDS